MTKGIDYNRWFETVTGWRPHDWQAALGSATECDNRLIRIPTGLGKTEGVLAAWLLHSVRPAFQPDNPGQPGKADVQTWPRRLVWCLPMRVLVEQTAERCRTIIDRWAETVGLAKEDRPRVHVLMGGEDTDRWWLEPERHAGHAPLARPQPRLRLGPSPLADGIRALESGLPVGDGRSPAHGRRPAHLRPTPGLP